MNQKNLDKLITQALAIDAEEARKAVGLGFMARALVQATLPHRHQEGTVFQRRNGSFTLSILTHPEAGGIPYGSIPRLLVAWVTTEAIRTRCPVLELGPTLSGFMAKLGLTPTGGRWGSIGRLRDQMIRLFSSSISCIYRDVDRTDILNVQIVKSARLWWDPKSPDQIPLWKSTLTLGTDFFEEILGSPVPIDLRALKALKRSPMALDIYCWLTHRMSYLQRPVEIPWALLQMQFGADYAADAHGLRNFKMKFLKQLRAVHVVYPEAKVEDAGDSLLLRPSKPHVAQLPEPLPYLKTEMPHPQLPEEQGIRLQTETYNKAKRAAPGWDVYHLEREWREWIANKDKPKNPDAAFIAFCRKKHQREGKP